jgi:hypothetical protein
LDHHGKLTEEAPDQRAYDWELTAVCDFLHFSKDGIGGRGDLLQVGFDGGMNDLHGLIALFYN